MSNPQFSTTNHGNLLTILKKHKGSILLYSSLGYVIISKRQIVKELSKYGAVSTINFALEDNMLYIK